MEFIDIVSVDINTKEVNVIYKNILDSEAYRIMQNIILNQGNNNLFYCIVKSGKYNNIKEWDGRGFPII